MTGKQKVESEQRGQCSPGNKCKKKNAFENLKVFQYIVFGEI